MKLRTSLIDTLTYFLINSRTVKNPQLGLDSQMGQNLQHGLHSHVYQEPQQGFQLEGIKQKNLQRQILSMLKCFPELLWKSHVTHAMPCDASTVVRTYLKFVRCPYCSSNIVFPGFSYKKIDHGSEKYSSVQYWMSCPSCRGDNMCLWTSSDRWICQDCGYSFSELQRLKGVFWFCDCCETYMNVQPGFKNRGETWKCTECGFENCVM